MDLLSAFTQSQQCKPLPLPENIVSFLFWGSSLRGLQFCCVGSSNALAEALFTVDFRLGICSYFHTFLLESPLVQLHTKCYLTWLFILQSDKPVTVDVSMSTGDRDNDTWRHDTQQSSMARYSASPSIAPGERTATRIVDVVSANMAYHTVELGGYV